MTLTEINEKISQLKKVADEYYEGFSKTLDEIKLLRVERNKILIATNQYNSFPLLREFIGKNIRYLSFLKEDGTIDEFYCGDIFTVDENGYPYFNDYMAGIIEFDTSLNTWVHHYHYSQKQLRYIGYVDIEFEE